MGPLGNQLKHVLRRLRRAPMFGAITLLTLAIGIGANTAIFSVIESVLLKPLPYPHPEQLVSIMHRAPEFHIDLPSAPGNYFIYREEGRTFQDVGLFTMDTMSVTGQGDPEQVRSLLVTDGVLPILGVPPAMGRGFTKKDDSPGSPDTVVLMWGYWRRKFGGDPAMIGRRIMVDGKAREVIGVMPERFRFLDADPALLAPLQFDRAKLHLGNFSFPGIGRLKPGVTVAQATADVQRIGPIWLRSFPPPPGFTAHVFEGVQPNLKTLRQFVIGDVGSTLWVLMATIGMVLLIACANIANLLLARTAGRQQELAIRAALGAGRGRLAAELFSESLTLAVIGGALGLGLARAALALLTARAPAGLPRLGEIGIDVPVLVFAFGVSLFSGVLFGFIPVLKYAGTRLGQALRGGGRTASQSRERHRARNVLVVVQVALALVLLVSSGLMIRTSRALLRVEPGFTRPAELQTLQISLPDAAVPDARVAAVQEDLVRKVAAIPGVVSVGLVSDLPMSDSGTFDPVFAEDHRYAEGELAPIRRFEFISPDYFRTMGNPLLAGRDITWKDIHDKTAVALVSDSFAREYWGGRAAAIGKRVREGPNSAWREVVGVVGDERSDGVSKPAPTIVYWPMQMRSFYGNDLTVRHTMSFVIRSGRAGSASLMKDIEHAVWSVKADLPLDLVRTQYELYRQSMARTSFTLVMLAFAGGMALLLGVVGIYGVIAYSVSQRTREIGIRMALGARPEELARMFVRHGLVLTGIGLGFGLVAAIALMRLMTSLLFEVSPADPLTYGAVSVGLLGAAALASYLPSRRAAAVDPTEALRAE
ncbi:MAG: ABC transporter permease [Bryobacteraceae bacterium]|jgi:predicted permease